MRAPVLSARCRDRPPVGISRVPATGCPLCGADDLFSALAAVRLKEDRLTLDEIGTFATTLITVGSETTYCSVTGAVLALLEHPDQLALLRADRSLIPYAVDEILRWVTPVTHFARNVVADTEIAGQRLNVGDRIVM